MICSVLLAGVFSFTASATGLEKGAPVEFLFVGKDSDREYEALFVLDDSVADFCAGLEKAGLERGQSVDVSKCILWPSGVSLKLEPSLDTFVDTQMPEGMTLASPVYAGGARDAKGTPVAHTNQPFSVFALYSLAQSPIVFNGIYEQGVVYNCHHVSKTLRKGEKRTFKLSWDEATAPKRVSYVIRPDNPSDVLKSLKAQSSVSTEVVAQVDFDGQLTVAQATAVATALSVLDSASIKINGCRDGALYYRAFLPLVKWQDRQERLVQPFELTVGVTNQLVFIDEDWSGEGDDPKLSPRPITFAEAARHPQTDTCFIFARTDTRLEVIYKAMLQLKASSVRNWYVFSTP